MAVLRQCDKCKTYKLKQQTKDVELETYKDNVLVKTKVIWCTDCYTEVMKPKEDKPIIKLDTQ